MADWLEALKAHIAANGLGTDGVDLFIGTMADTGQTAPVAALNPTSGTTRETLGDGGVAVDIPGMQVSVRAPGYAAARDRIEAIRNLLKQIKNQNIQGRAFLRVTPDGTYNDLGRDASNRQMFSANFNVWIQS